MISRYWISLLVALGTGALGACGGQTRVNPSQQTQTTQSTDTDTTVDDSDPVDAEDEDDDPVDTDDSDSDAPITSDASDFNTACESYSDCPDDMVCAGFTKGATVCTTLCVGSGKGGNDDCPSGWACIDWDSTTLDGLQVCYSASQLGSSYSGYPFKTPARGACSSSNDSCQTVCNTSTNTCEAMCMANRDCDSGETCNATSDGSAHFCQATNSRLAETGDACSNDSDCDSGICLGECDDGSACGSSSDCGGSACSGTCVDHCRSEADCDTSVTACSLWPMNKAGYGSGWVPVCGGRLYSGTRALGDACTSDRQCESEACINDICTTPCASADDCADLMPGTDCAALNFSTSESDGQTVFSSGYCY